MKKRAIHPGLIAAVTILMGIMFSASNNQATPAMTTIMKYFGIGNGMAGGLITATTVVGGHYGTSGWRHLRKIRNKETRACFYLLLPGRKYPGLFFRILWHASGCPGRAGNRFRHVRDHRTGADLRNFSAGKAGTAHGTLVLLCGCRNYVYHEHGESGPEGR